MDHVFTPWRYSYLVQPPTSAECIFCAAAAAADSDESLVLRRAEHNLVLLNLFPYNNGHILIAPYAHVASPSAATPQQRAEMMELTASCDQALRAEYHPDGVNVGMNLGRAAGAGVESHYHLHILPRWFGDTNFMTVTARTRIIPEELQVTRARLRAALERVAGPAAGGPRV